MPLNDVKFTRQRGGLGRVAPSEDHVSGLIFYGQDSAADYILSSAEDLPSDETTGFKAFDPRNTDANVGKNNIVYYHVSEFFRMNPTGRLHLKLVESAGSNYSEIKDLQFAAKRKIRQVGVYDESLNFTESSLALPTNFSSLKSVAVALEEEHAPLQILVQGDLESGSQALTKLGKLYTLAGANSKNVSVVIAESKSGLAKAMRDKGTSNLIGAIGTALGATSRASVHENIAWVQKFNLAGGEFDIPGFSNGLSVAEVGKGVLEELNNRRYIFTLKHTGDAGTYFNDSHTAIKATHDFAYIESNRTIDKAIRGVRASLLPQLNSALSVNESGQLSADSIKFFENLVKRSLERMVNDGELSEFGVLIQPDQDVLGTSTLNISLQLVPRGIARNIKVSIGFTTKLNA